MMNNIRFIINLTLTLIIFATYGLAMESNIIRKYSIGFEEIHQMGIKGKGQTVILLEPNFIFQPDHPAFNGIEVQCIDVGCHPKCPEGFKDLSPFRYDQGFKPLGLDFMDDYDHCQKVLSVLVGTPCNDYSYGGGIAPEAKPILVSCSHTSIPGCRAGWVNSIIRCASSAVYTFAKLNEFLSDQNHRDMLNQALALYPKTNLLNQKIDDSIFNAFRIIFNSPGRVINASFNLQTPLDYKNSYRVIPEFLDFLAEGLERTDKILIFTAGNNSLDITSSLATSEEALQNSQVPNLSWSEQMTYENDYVRNRTLIYCQELANHPSLKDRVRMLVNIMPVPSEQSFIRPQQKASKTNIQFENKNSFDIQLYQSSNYPGNNKNLQAITLATFGSNLMVAASGGKFTTESGTSFSAPIAAGLITLMDENYIQQGYHYSGVELLKILDSSCILPDPEFAKYYGNGIPDPLIAIGVQKYKGSQKGNTEGNCVVF